MSNSISVSIITPVYNGETTIERTIKSVIGQGVEKLEYIIVDGNSTDGTRRIVEQYSDCIDRYICEEDDGVYDAINKGIISSTGDVIGIINADDWYEANALSEVIRTFVDSDYDLVYGDCFYVCEGNRILKKPIDLKMIITGMVFAHPAMFVKKTVYEKIGLYDTLYKIAADYDFIMRCYRAGLKFSYIPSALASFSYGGISTKNLEESNHEAEIVRDKNIEDDVLGKCFSEMLSSKLIVHGAGKWGTWLVEKLMRLFTEDIIWIDSKCNYKGEIQKLGLDISPVDMTENDRQVIVAIWDGESIKEDYLNKERNVITIQEILERYADLLFEGYYGR